MKKILFALLFLPVLLFGQATGLVITNKPSGGAIGTAAATVDVSSLINLNQTTASQILTVPNLTNASSGKIIYINNVGSTSLILSPGGLIAVGTGVVLRWDGVRWNVCGNGNAITSSTLAASLAAGNKVNGYKIESNSGLSYLDLTTGNMEFNDLAQSRLYFYSPASGRSFSIELDSKLNSHVSAFAWDTTGSEYRDTKLISFNAPNIEIQQGVASRLPYLGYDKRLIYMNVDSAGLYYLSGVTSNIQTQLNSKYSASDTTKFMHKLFSVTETVTGNKTFSGSNAYGTPASITLTNGTGTANGLTAGNVTTNANLTGPVTSVGNTTSIASSVNLPGSPTTTTQSAADNSTKIATTSYVDNAVLGQRQKEAVKYASTAALPSIVYSNGSSGVGATLTGVALAAISLDGASPSINDRVLIKNQATTFQNGIYIVTQTGSGIAVFILTRATDFDQAADIQTGDMAFVTSGTANSNLTYTYNGADSPVMGTDAITFTQSAGVYAAGNGILITSGAIAIDPTITVDKTTAQVLTNKDLSSGTNTFPTLNQNTTGSAATLTTPRTIGGNSFNGSANITVATATGGFTVSGGDLALGANNLTMTGSIGATGSRVTKGWFTDFTLTNAPKFDAFTTNGGLLFTNGSGTVSQTGAGTSTTILHGGTTPSYSAVSLSADVTGTLPLANGGTGGTTMVTARSGLGINTILMTSGDQTTTSNASANITDLVTAVDANSVYTFVGQMKIGCNNTGGVKFAVTIPASATMMFTVFSFGASATAFVANAITVTNTLTTNAVCTVNGTGGMHILGTVTTAGTSGNVQFKFASGNNTETSTIYKEGTFITATKQ